MVLPFERNKLHAHAVTVSVRALTLEFAMEDQSYEHCSMTELSVYFCVISLGRSTAPTQCASLLFWASQREIGLTYMCLSHSAVSLIHVVCIRLPSSFFLQNIIKHCYFISGLCPSSGIPSRAQTSRKLHLFPFSVKMCENYSVQSSGPLIKSLSL
jgi:hypothetical protein